MIATVDTAAPFADPPRLRRRAVREPRPRHRRRAEGQRPADPRRAEGAARRNRGRLRARSSGSPMASPAKPAATTSPRSSATAGYGAGLIAGTRRIIARIAEGRNIELERRAAARRTQAPARLRIPVPLIIAIFIAHLPDEPAAARTARRQAILGARRLERLVERCRTVRRRRLDARRFRRRVRRRRIRRRFRRIRRRTIRRRRRRSGMVNLELGIRNWELGML